MNAAFPPVAFTASPENTRPSFADLQHVVGVLCCVLAVFVLASAVYARDFFVSPEGADDNPGTWSQPFRTLKRARDAVRTTASGIGLEGLTVFVRGGVYCLEETLALSRDDSGTAAAPVVYRAYGTEKPVLVGGRRITEFTPHAGEILRADLSGLGLADTRIRLLVCDGQRQELARYPNANPGSIGGGDWAYVDGTRYSMYADSPDEDSYLSQHRHLDFWQRNIPRLTRTLRVKPADIRPWSRPEEAEVSIFPRFNWEHFLPRVSSVDIARRELSLEPGCYYEIRPGDRYFVRGLLEELDSPGEWYVDAKAQVLYFWPPTPLEGKAVYLATLSRLVDLTDCAHVTVRGLTLECCNGTAVTLTDCTNCLVAGNIIRNVGDVDGCGVTVVGGAQNRIVGNDIYDIGADGVDVAAGDTIRLERAEIQIDNNYIHHVGRVARSATGISLRLGFRDGLAVGRCAGVRVRHNLIHDTPQSGVFLWGSGHTIEYNRIRHTCTESEDTGAIGGGAIDWLSWLDTTIRYNYIQDTLGYGYDAGADAWVSPYFAAALYPDWAASGVTIVGNVLVRAPRACLLLHSGRDNLIENNILVDGGATQMYWRGWTTAEGFWSTMVDGWIRNFELAIQHPAWRDVPALKDPRQVPIPDHRVMTGNVFRRNIVYYTDPRADLFTMETVPLEHNQSDFNLVYHAGHPLRTGTPTVRQEIGPNLIPNPGLEEGELNGAPLRWNVAALQHDGTRLRVVDELAHAGASCLLIEPAATPPDGARATTAYLTLGSLPFQPGKAYRLSAWMRSGDPPACVELCVFSWKKDVHSWSVQSTAALSPAWRQYDLVFRLPQQGDSQYRSSMDTLLWRLNVAPGSGRFWVDDISLCEVVLGDDWEGWQALGMDRHSLVADPLFVDPAQDDYRLQPQSPAYALGFQPIAIEKIGPYDDELRASWPIVEAPGIRETMARR